MLLLRHLKRVLASSLRAELRNFAQVEMRALLDGMMLGRILRSKVFGLV
jgi:hypothetical protein